MLAMNLIKVFPAWYHPSLTWSVTHAQISQLTYPFITTTEEGCEKEGTDAVGYFQQMLLATSDLSLRLS